MGVSRLGAILASLAVLAGCSHAGGASHALPATSLHPGGLRTARSVSPAAVVQTANASNTGTGGGNTLSISLGAAPTPGHLLLAGFMYGDGTGSAPAAPAGWQLVKQANSGVNYVVSIAVYSRVARAGDPAGPYTFTIGPSSVYDAITLSLKEIGGTDPANPVDVVTSASLSGGRAMTLPPATASRTGDLALAYFSQLLDGGTVSGFTPGAGWQITDQLSGANALNAAQVEVLSSPASGTTAPLSASESWQNGGNSSQVGVEVLVQPQIAAPAGSAIGIVQSAHGTSVNSSSVAAALPAQTTAGNQLVAAVMWSDSAAEPVSAPAGWTRIDHVEHTNYVGITLFTKAVDGTDNGAPYVFTTPSEHHFSVVVDEVQGVDLARPVNAFGSQVMNGGYSATAHTNAAATTSGGLQLAFFNQYNGGAQPSAFAPGSGFTQRDVIVNPSGEHVAEQTVGTVLSATGALPSTTESWQNGYNSTSVSEMLVLAPAPGTIVWSIGDPWGLPSTSDGQGADVPVFAGTPANCVPEGTAAQCTGGSGPVSFHVQRADTTTVPAPEYRNMMVVQKYDPVRNYAFNYELVPNGVYDVRFQTVNHMKDDAQYVQSLIWQDHAGDSNVLTSLGVINPDGRGNQFFFNSGASTGNPGDPNTWHGTMTQGAVDTWEIQFRNAQDASGWADLYRNGVLQIHLTGRVVTTTSYDLMSFGIYYYNWQISRSTVLSQDITFNYFELSTIPGPVPPAR